MEFHHIVPQDGDIDGDIERDEENPTSPDSPIWSEVITMFFCLNFSLMIPLLHVTDLSFDNYAAVLFY